VKPYYADGPVTLYHGDCVEVMAGMPEASVDAIVTDPPYDLLQGSRGGSGRSNEPNNPFGRHGSRGGGFMGMTWDATGVAFRPETWATARRVLRPGGHLLAFGGTRTAHRMVCAIEDAGFEVRDTLAWLYGSGFPKSHNLRGDWDGWGTALKPAYEPIVLARRPLAAGSVAANVLAHGTGALNVDGCRIEGRPEAPGTTPATPIVTPAHGAMVRAPYMVPEGRWPANVVLDEEAAALLDAQSGERPGMTPGVLRRGATTGTSIGGQGRYGTAAPAAGIAGYGDTGGASRFFYTAKASTAERQGVTHPTVKPVALMRWLVRLVTPPGGVVLDCFAGSGTTRLAALAEGFRVVLIEQDAGYLEQLCGRAAQTGLPFDGA
jgi:site-specific DNA-methyltransferase (adenine-specific)